MADHVIPSRRSGGTPRFLCRLDFGKNVCVGDMVWGMADHVIPSRRTPCERTVSEGGVEVRGMAEQDEDWGEVS